MDDASLRKQLRSFGLSEKEVDTYLTILSHGEAKASTIADDAGVSKRYVYSISEDLEERGFVEVNDHAVPTMIRAKPPEVVLETLGRSLEQMRPELEARFTSTTEKIEQFEVIKSRATVIKRIREALDRASEEVTLSIPISVLDEVSTELAAAVDRGVLVLLLVGGELDEFDRSDLPDGLLDGLSSAVRTWREKTPMMLTADREVGLIAPYTMVTRSHSESQAIMLAQEQLVPVLVGSFLGNYWPMADELSAAEPAELPATYDVFRHAVLQATLQRRAGRVLEATVRAKPVHEDGGEMALNGEIVNVRQSLLHPPTNSFPVENALVLQTDDGTYSVGGEGAFVEDLEAVEVTLRARKTDTGNDTERSDE